MIGIDIQGTGEVKDLLSMLPKKMEDKVIRNTARKGAMVIRTAARRAMPWQLGDVGEVGKKAVVINNDKYNKSAVNVTIGNTLVTLNGKQISIGKVIRHMTAGKQNIRFRSTKSGKASTGKVRERYGDFIQKAFDQKKNEAMNVMAKDFEDILTRTWQRR